MSEEQTSFKVTDRRLFNADGSPRELPAEEKQDRAAEQPTVGATTSAQDNSPLRGVSEQRTATAPAQSSPAPAESPHDDEEDVDVEAQDPASFVNFLMSIASNAASALGMMEHPVTHKREVDLELGKHWIDVLGMLQLKTRGNLTSQEQQITEGLLSDLRMQYVSLANSPQAKSAGPFTGRDIIGGK